MKNLILFLGIVCSTVAYMQSQILDTPQIAIKIEEGATLKLKGIQITFESVLEDSRCPKYTNCVWQGQAIVQLKITDKAGTESIRKVILSNPMKNDSSDHILYKDESYSIEVVGLNPYPEDGAEESRYSLLVVERN